MKSGETSTGASTSATTTATTAPSDSSFLSFLLGGEDSQAWEAYLDEDKSRAFAQMTNANRPPHYASYPPLVAFPRRFHHQQRDSSREGSNASHHDPASSSIYSLPSPTSRARAISSNSNSPTNTNQHAGSPRDQHLISTSAALSLSAGLDVDATITNLSTSGSVALPNSHSRLLSPPKSKPTSPEHSPRSSHREKSSDGGDGKRESKSHRPNSPEPSPRHDREARDQKERERAILGEALIVTVVSSDGGERGSEKASKEKGVSSPRVSPRVAKRRQSNNAVAKEAAANSPTATATTATTTITSTSSPLRSAMNSSDPSSAYPSAKLSTSMELRKVKEEQLKEQQQRQDHVDGEKEKEQLDEAKAKRESKREDSVGKKREKGSTASSRSSSPRKDTHAIVHSSATSVANSRSSSPRTEPAHHHLHAAHAAKGESSSTPPLAMTTSSGHQHQHAATTSTSSNHPTALNLSFLSNPDGLPIESITYSDSIPPTTTNSSRSPSRGVSPERSPSSQNDSIAGQKSSRNKSRPTTPERRSVFANSKQSRLALTSTDSERESREKEQPPSSSRDALQSSDNRAALALSSSSPGAATHSGSVTPSNSGSMTQRSSVTAVPSLPARGFSMGPSPLSLASVAAEKVVGESRLNSPGIASYRIRVKDRNENEITTSVTAILREPESPEEMRALGSIYRLRGPHPSQAQPANLRFGRYYEKSQCAFLCEVSRDPHSFLPSSSSPLPSPTATHMRENSLGGNASISREPSDSERDYGSVIPTIPFEKEYLFIICAKSKNESKNSERRKCFLMCAFGCEEITILPQAGKSSLLHLPHQSQVISREISHFLSAGHALTVHSVREFKLKKKIAEELNALEKTVLEKRLVKSISVGLVVRNSHEQSSIAELSENKTISQELEAFMKYLNPALNEMDVLVESDPAPVRRSSGTASPKPSSVPLGRRQSSKSMTRRSSADDFTVDYGARERRNSAAGLGNATLSTSTLTDDAAHREEERLSLVASHEISNHATKRAGKVLARNSVGNQPVVRSVARADRVRRSSDVPRGRDRGRSRLVDEGDRPTNLRRTSTHVPSIHMHNNSPANASSQEAAFAIAATATFVSAQKMSSPGRERRAATSYAATTSHSKEAQRSGSETNSPRAEPESTGEAATPVGEGNATAPPLLSTSSQEKLQLHGDSIRAQRKTSKHSRERKKELDRTERDRERAHSSDREPSSDALNRSGSSTDSLQSSPSPGHSQNSSADNLHKKRSESLSKSSQQKRRPSFVRAESDGNAEATTTTNDSQPQQPNGLSHRTALPWSGSLADSDSSHAPSPLSLTLSGSPPPSPSSSSVSPSASAQTQRGNIRRREILKNLNAAVEQFEEMRERALEREEAERARVNATKSFLPREARWRWADRLEVTFHVAPKLTRDEVRRNVGNSSCLVIFDESPGDEPFNPINLFLGKVTTYVLVVKPVRPRPTMLPSPSKDAIGPNALLTTALADLPPLPAIPTATPPHVSANTNTSTATATPTSTTTTATVSSNSPISTNSIPGNSNASSGQPHRQYRLAQFLHYEQRWNSVDPYVIQAVLERTFADLRYSPLIPRDYVFSAQHVQLIVMTLLHNAVASAYSCHPQVCKMVAQPISARFNELVNKYSL